MATYGRRRTYGNSSPTYASYQRIRSQAPPDWDQVIAGNIPSSQHEAASSSSSPNSLEDSPLLPRTRGARSRNDDRRTTPADRPRTQRKGGALAKTSMESSGGRSVSDEKSTPSTSPSGGDDAKRDLGPNAERSSPGDLHVSPPSPSTLLRARAPTARQARKRKADEWTWSSDESSAGIAKVTKKSGRAEKAKESAVSFSTLSVGLGIDLSRPVARQEAVPVVVIPPRRRSPVRFPSSLAVERPSHESGGGSSTQPPSPRIARLPKSPPTLLRTASQSKIETALLSDLPARSISPLRERRGVTETVPAAPLRRKPSTRSRPASQLQQEFSEESSDGGGASGNGKVGGISSAHQAAQKKTQTHFARPYTLRDVRLPAGCFYLRREIDESPTLRRSRGSTDSNGFAATEAGPSSPLASAPASASQERKGRSIATAAKRGGAAGSRRSARRGRATT